MEYLIKNAVIATMDKEMPFAASVAVRDGKYVQFIDFLLVIFQ